ncbi:MAG: diguanylate cyclase [Burkholderiales bacterium]
MQDAPFSTEPVRENTPVSGNTFRKRCLAFVGVLAALVIASQIAIQNTISAHAQAPAGTMASPESLIQAALFIAMLVVLALAVKFVFAPAVSSLNTALQGSGERETDLERLFSASPTALLLIDANSLEIVRSNREAEKLLGTTTDELASLPFIDLLDAGHVTNQSFLEKLIAGDSLSEYEVLLMGTENRSIQALAASCSTTFGGRWVHMLGLTSIDEIKKAQQDLRYYATFDEKTGLVNRKTGLMLLEKEMDRVKRTFIPTTVCFADIVNLKQVNDRHGHQDGDWMIQTLSRAMTDVVRKGDAAIRLDIAEFMLVLHACPLDQAQLLLHRVEKRMAEIAFNDPKLFDMRIRFGLALFDPKHHTGVELVIAAAAQDTYEYKLGGRRPAILQPEE